VQRTEGILRGKIGSHLRTIKKPLGSKVVIARSLAKKPRLLLVDRSDNMVGLVKI